jgi:hypothetical protein
MVIVVIYFRVPHKLKKKYKKKSIKKIYQNAQKIVEN